MVGVICQDGEGVRLVEDGLTAENPGKPPKESSSGRGPCNGMQQKYQGVLQVELALGTDELTHRKLPVQAELPKLEAFGKGMPSNPHPRRK